MRHLLKNKTKKRRKERKKRKSRSYRDLISGLIPAILSLCVFLLSVKMKPQTSLRPKSTQINLHVSSCRTTALTIFNHFQVKYQSINGISKGTYPNFHFFFLVQFYFFTNIRKHQLQLKVFFLCNQTLKRSPNISSKTHSFFLPFNLCS